ncbi:hypothetical protein Tco_1179080 [Tanacetum coccineum]
MSAITDVKCVLSQKEFDAFCEKFHIPEEVLLVLPNRGDTMHERPAGKIRHFRINISQLSVIGAAKVDDFACPARFSWHTAKNVTMDPAPAAADFNAQDYATLVAHPSPFRKIPEEFLCLVGLSRHYTLDEETYPSFLDKDGEGDCLLLYGYLCFHSHSGSYKVKIAERERIEGEPRLLETTVSRIVPLLPVAPNRGESELEASVDKLFDEGGSGTQSKQGDSAGGGGGQGVNIEPVIEVADAATEDLREDHGTPSGPYVARKSRSAVQRLLAGAILNAEVRGEPIPALPFVTSSVSAMPERANVTEAEVDYLVRSTVPLMTIVTTVIPPVDSAVVTKEKSVKPSLFGVDSSSAGRSDPTPGGFSSRTGSDFLVGGIRTVIDPDSNLQKVYIP